MDNTFQEEFGFGLSDMQSSSDQSDNVSEMRFFVNRIGSFFRPVNVIDAQTSAVHYNVSPYAYVLNNPLKYRDWMGLDTTKTTTLPTVTVEANREESNHPLWLGPLMYGAGQPWMPKRFVTPGSSPGTSIASTVLNKAIPINSPVRLPTPPVVGKTGLRRTFTKSIGKFLGRWTPVIGLAITAYDFTKEVAIPMSQSAAEYNKANRESGNWISNLPH